MKNASIEKILKLEPIEGADKIEKASILGWQTVTLKGVFKVGDYCVFIPVDSIVPELPVFEFMRDRHFRVRKMKLKGTLSQGLAMPVTDFTDLLTGLELSDGLDVADKIGVKHYEKPVPINMQGLVKGNFPEFLHKTDEERLQNVPNLPSRHIGKVFVATEKIDGTSATFYLKDDVFGVCSRNLELKENKDNIYWQISEGVGIERALRKIKEDSGFDMAIQGEIYGMGINKNPLGMKGVMFACFNLFNITEQTYESYHVFRAVCDKHGIEPVPSISTFEMMQTMDVKFFEDMSKGDSKKGQVKREGIVVRPLIDCYDSEVGRCSFKVINPEYKED